MDYNNISIERSEPLLKVTLNRPKKLNAMSREVISEMLHLFIELRTALQIKKRVREIKMVVKISCLCSPSDM